MKQKLQIGLMIDSYIQPLWIYDIIKSIKQEESVNISIIILKKENLQKINSSNSNSQKRPNNAISRINLELKKEYLFHEYVEWDKRFYGEWWNKYHKSLGHNNFNSFEQKDCSVLLNDIFSMIVVPKETKYSDYILENDLKVISSKNLDIIIRFGFRIIKGDILNIPKYGIWSFHHDDNNEYRGGPPLFWEIYENNPRSGTILQILTPNLDGGMVIYKSIGKTHNFSYFINQNLAYWKTSTFILRCLKQINYLGWETFKTKQITNSNSKYLKKIYTCPNNKQMFLMHWKLLWRNIKNIIKDNIYKEIWLIKIFKNTIAFTIKTEQGHWYADPFLIENNNKTYLFFEDFNEAESKGCISFIQINSDNTFSKPTIAINESFHLSYPFIFEDNGDYYIMPESYQDNNLKLYKATNFPSEWIHIKNLIPNICAIDPTLLKHNNKYWLFFNIKAHGADFNDELHLYYSESLEGEWISHPLNPIISNTELSRPAGRIYFENNRIFRPSQDCLKSYGHAININEILEITENTYKEVFIKKTYPNSFGNYTGVHTFNFIDNLKVYDFKVNKLKKNIEFRNIIKEIRGLYFHKPIRIFIKHLIKVFFKTK